LKKKILTILGTRPEAIKLAPIIIELRKFSYIDTRVCVTAQHRQMLDQVLSLFDILPDIDLDLMQSGQSLADLTARVFSRTDRVLMEEKPNIILVQGDTTTVMAAAVTAFYRNITVGHVEAGLRSENMLSPFPEELNRRIAGLVSGLHFAPTRTAVKALRREGVPDGRIFLTGNPVIDALRMIVSQPTPEKAKSILEKAGVKGDGDDPHLILVTAHRRENFGERFESLCMGLKKLAERNTDIVIIYPVHLNPNVQEPVNRILGNTERIILIAPVDYDVLAHLMKNAYLVLTESGGIQEEAPSLGKPVLVMRTETERPEGIEAGTAKLVGPFEDKIVAETELLLRNSKVYQDMTRTINPYGDGHAAERIVKILREKI
jgi:UDP-N-acetylglucosamine 2-epimerase (non-hydrolysing)